MNLAQPAWLIVLLLLPLLAVGAVLLARLRRRQWQDFVAPRLRSALLKRGSSLPRWFALLFLLGSVAALVGAMSRPQGDAGTKTEKSLGRNVLIALDLSRSMRVTDIRPDRLSQAKVIIYEMLEAMPNERVGLIGFAGSAYLYAPLTIDHGAIRETVEQIDETWAPLGGSDLAAAIRLAIQTLKETGQKNNALVILSDGEELDGDIDAMLTEAEASGVYIFAIAIGTDDGGFVPHPDYPNGQLLDSAGKPVLSRVQADVMRKLAAETGGRFAAAGTGMNAPAMVKAAIQDLDSFELEGRERRISVEFYQWLVLPGILFLMASILAGTRWRGMGTTAIIAFCFFFPTQADAASANDAKKLLDEKQYKQARDAYRSLAENSNIPQRSARYRLGQGISAYRAGDFRGARSAYSYALLSSHPEVGANAHIGMGNSLFQLGWQGLSGEDAYPVEPGEIPDLDRFDELVKERLARMLEAEEPEKGETDGYARFRAIIINWTDAIRHYDSALKNFPNDPTAHQNRKTTLVYLKRLRELLEQEEKETQEAMPEPQAGEGEPQPGQEPGEGEDPGEEPGENGQEPGENEGDEPSDEPGENGQDGEENEDGKGDEGDETEDGKSGDKNPNESPEERARRILSENADTETGPLSPGRREFRNPEKDW